MEKHKKNHITVINLKYLLKYGMKNLNFQIDHIPYQIFKIILSIFKKNHGENIDNHSIGIYVNKIKSRITFTIKTGYYLELLTPETMKLLGTQKIKWLKIRLVKMYPI